MSVQTSTYSSSATPIVTFSGPRPNQGQRRSVRKGIRQPSIRQFYTLALDLATWLAEEKELREIIYDLNLIRDELDDCELNTKERSRENSAAFSAQIEILVIEALVELGSDLVDLCRFDARKLHLTTRHLFTRVGTKVIQGRKYLSRKQADSAETMSNIAARKPTGDLAKSTEKTLASIVGSAVRRVRVLRGLSDILCDRSDLSEH